MGIITDVQLLLNDSGVFWPATQVLDAINEGQFWVWTKTKWSRTNKVLTLTRGLDIISLPEDILIPGWIEGEAPGDGGQFFHFRCFPTTQRNLEHHLRTWRGAPLGQPLFFTIWDATHLRIFPRPKQDYSYAVWGIGWPTEVTTDVVLGGPSIYTLAVKNYAVGLLLEATRPDLADYYYALAEKSIAEWRRTLRNQQSHNIRRLRPGAISISGGPYTTLTPPGRFDLQQGGAITALPTYYPLEN
jgi:hypothetical protein